MALRFPSAGAKKEASFVRNAGGGKAVQRTRKGRPKFCSKDCFWIFGDSFLRKNVGAPTYRTPIPTEGGLAGASRSHRSPRAPCAQAKGSGEFAGSVAGCRRYEKTRHSLQRQETTSEA